MRSKDIKETRELETLNFERDSFAMPSSKTELLKLSLPEAVCG
jgi:hypothetical protein